MPTSLPPEPAETDIIIRQLRPIAVMLDLLDDAWAGDWPSRRWSIPSWRRTALSKALHELLDRDRNG